VLAAAALHGGPADLLDEVVVVAGQRFLAALRLAAINYIRAATNRAGSLPRPAKDLAWADGAGISVEAESPPYPGQSDWPVVTCAELDHHRRGAICPDRTYRLWYECSSVLVSSSVLLHASPILGSTLLWPSSFLHSARVVGAALG